MSSKSKSKAGSGKAAKSPKAPSKSKLIKEARKTLSKVLKEHAEITSGSGVSLKKAQRLGAKLSAAAAAYAEAVQAKTGLESPFVPGNGRLDGATIKSLKAEREAIVTGSIPVVAAESEAAPAEAAPAETSPAPAPVTRRTSAARTTSAPAVGTAPPRAAAPLPGSDAQ